MLQALQSKSNCKFPIEQRNSGLSAMKNAKQTTGHIDGRLGNLVAGNQNSLTLWMFKHLSDDPISH